MNRARSVLAAFMLAVEVVLAGLAVVVHYGFTAEYGNTTDNAWEGFVGGFTHGVGPVALTVVVAAAVLTVLAATKSRPRILAAVIPVVMVVSMFLATPFALQDKRDAHAVSQCEPDALAPHS